MLMRERLLLMCLLMLVVASIACDDDFNDKVRKKNLEMCVEDCQDYFNSGLWGDEGEELERKCVAKCHDLYGKE